MSKSSYLSANVDVTTDSFGGWINKTNLIINDMGTVVVTVASVAQPNTTNGAQTTGNSHIEGRFSANTLIAATALRGGTVSTPANLVIISNTVFNESALVQISANTNLFDIDANNMVISSNVTFDGGSTKRILIDAANTTVNTGSFFIRSNTEFTGVTANVGTTTLNVTANSIFSGANVYITSTNTTIGDAGTDGLTVNAVADFNANVNIDGALTTINSTNTTIGDAGTDKLNLIAESIFSANATFNGALVNITSTNTTIGNAATDILNVNAVSDFNANVNIDGILSQTANAIFSGALVNITSVNTTIGDASTDILNVNAVSDFNANVNVDGILTVANSATVSGTLTVNTQANTASLMVRDLTATRIPYVGTAGEIVDSANLVFSGTNLNIIGTANVTTNANVGGTLGVTGAAIFANTVGITGVATFSNNIVMADNRTIIMGNSQDFMIYHDGSHSYISDLGTGNLKLDASQLDIQTSNSTATETMATFVRDGAVTLFHDNTARIATSSTGASVTGILAVSGNETVGGTLAVTGAATFSNTVGITGATTATAITASGLIDLTNTTDATSSTVAAVKTAGGLAVAKKLYVGAETVLGGNTTIAASKYLIAPFINVSNNLIISGNTVANNLTVTGTTTLASDITLTVSNAAFTSALVTANLRFDTIATITGDMRPTANNVQDIGSSTAVWRTVYANNVLVTANLRFDTAATVTGNLIPSSNNAQDIGGGLKVWRTVYANNIVANVAWASVTDKPDPNIVVTLTGDVTGTANATLTDLANGTISIATTIASNAVALGTDTTGNYVATMAAGTPSTQSGSSGLTISATAGEGTAATIAHADTSSVSNLAIDNSNGTVLQDLGLTFDTFGHVTGTTSASVNLDLRYPQSAFTNIAVAGQTTVVSDSLTDTLTLVGAGIASITTNATTDTITITATEADTLASVTSRGNTTTNNITVNDLNANNVVISGNLTVSGTTTYINTTNLNVGDNIVTLNADFTGSVPTENAGIEVERGTLTNTALVWNETTDRWTFTNNGTNYFNIPVPTDVSWTIQDGDTTTYTITFDDTLQIASGTYITSNFTADDVLTISHNNTTRTDTTSTAAPNPGGTVTVVGGVTTNATGHVTAIDVETITLPTYDLLAVANTAANAGILRLKDTANANDSILFTGTGITTISSNATHIIANTPGTNLTATAGTTSGPVINSSTGTGVTIPSAALGASGIVTTGAQTFAGIKTFNSTISASINGNAATASVAATVTVAPSTSASAFKVPFTDTTGTVSGNFGLLHDSTATFTYNPSTNVLTAGTFSGALSGNATTATQWATARTVTFAGGDVSGSFTISGSGDVPNIVLTVADDSHNHTIANVDGLQTALDAKAPLTSPAFTGTPSIVGTTPALYFNETDNVAYGWTLRSATGDFDFLNAAGTNVFYITQTGDVVASNNITAFSDSRLKENIVTIDSALDKVSQMRGVYYNRIDDETKTRNVGVIAQEIEKILPEVVYDTADDIKSVAYGNIVGILIEAIKELSEEVKTLKSKLENAE
jgi:hypothetical protein